MRPDVAPVAARKFLVQKRVEHHLALLRQADAEACRPDRMQHARIGRARHDRAARANPEEKIGILAPRELEPLVESADRREQFSPRAPYRQRYELKGTIPAGLIAKAGFPSPEPYVTGPLGVTSFAYQVASNGTSELQGRFDLKAAKVALAPLGWTKDAGADGQLNLVMKLAAGAKLTTADLDVRGRSLPGPARRRSHRTASTRPWIRGEIPSDSAGG